ncbi:ABC transporter permease [Rhodobacter capsulatus]|jgi:spermidine/putrescine transport system permease protein|uniref:Polyamine ABC transporter, permease protein PotC-2 n=1 Tax=Rhodobacter capsulatus (strain ATCC BAA-309 / NBRC 16581 / SB1003) TaxID=272942 RepID=D5AL06_RHOCB|nr:ABC transporter permease [Rhodobacter capsulatus]ADE85996.1 polyamine ABC transporter, permease protein PotC-2 [Rhodobacter capsulatus SB 1003]ETD01093.1 ABC transporter permease [Rhodobacter capsulatus DE442]ETD75678.1 ABC transporter permease [Rhodobacter capsulatus R121]ETE53310.1 ABC transporter permease [Rhodobacter capsulatus Y262]MDS0927831.1 ABC transporter permease [Rhodobacter capsulatus]
MRLYAFVVYAFLYLPIGIIALFSFSAGRNASQMQGFSTQWYGRALSNPFVLDALQTSALIALSSAVLASIVGTLAALALSGMKGRLRTLFDALIYIAVMIPGIVIGIATLIALVTVFDAVNPWLEGATGWRLSMGAGSLIAAHGLFTMSLVIILVRARIEGMDRALLEASADLGAGPLATFRQVTLPLLAPAILAGFLLSFTFSFDDFIIAFFVAGSETTLPIYIFSSIRRGVTPEINAIGTMVMAVSLLMLVIAQITLRRGEKPNPQ